MAHWRIRWQSPMLWVGLLVVGLAGFWLGPRAWLVGAGEERPPCADWDQWWYHHGTTPQQIHYCLTHKHVDINQQDEEDGRTLLHRIARDFHEQYEDVSRYSDYHENTAIFAVDYFWEPPPEIEPPPEWEPPPERESQPGATREERLAMVRELLRWEELDLEIVDDSDHTAVQLALRKTKNWQVAHLLIQAGASLQFSESKAKELEENVLPMVQELGPRVRNPFTGEMDVEALLACQTANCLMEETLKD